MKQTLDKMKQMRLSGMARAFEMTLQAEKNEVFTADEMISHLVEAEWDDRHNRRLDRTLNSAKFRYKATAEQSSYEDNRVDKNQVQRLLSCEFIKPRENIIITGSTGIGKSFIASAIGHQACFLNHKVLYQHATKLFARLKLAKTDGPYTKEISKIEKQSVLIIDDFGIQPLDAQNRSALMEIIEDRHGKSSTIITS